MSRCVAATVAVLLALSRAAGAARDERPSMPAELLDRLEAAVRTRDVAAYLALWRSDAETVDQETDTARSLFSSEEVQLTLQRPSSATTGLDRLSISAQAFAATEPRARVEQWRFELERSNDGWAIVGRNEVGVIDGLVHLSLAPRGYQASGRRLAFEDFELRMKSGSIFTSPENLGPTLIVFVGEGEVTVSPRPRAERAQLRIFCGEETLNDKVRAAFIRIHPADLHRVLSPAELVPDPDASRHRATAERLFRELSHRYFVLDAPLPRSPWWLMPAVGDASVTFETRKNGELVFALNSSEPEDLNLFDRLRRRQILLYPSGGRKPLYQEDDGKAIDVLHTDLKVRFDPPRRFLEAEATLRLKLLRQTPTLRLRLDDAFQVDSVTSPGGNRQLFFRVRGQNSLMVSLGGFQSASDEIALTVRYSGRHEPTEVHDEVLQVGVPREPTTLSTDVFIEPVLVYTNRTAWYPRASLDDHSTATLRFEVPPGTSVVTGGERTLARTSSQLSSYEYRMDQPAKYLTAAVGRFQEVGQRQAGAIALRAFGLGRTRDDAQAMLDQAARILAFYEQIFGPCPYPSINLVAIEGQAPGGHAPPGMVLIQRRPPLLSPALRDDPANFPGHPEFFLAHELAHQWWGQGVSGSNYRERWLSEGFAQYAAALWIQKNEGEAAFQDVLSRMARWVLRHDGDGAIHLGYRVGHLRDDPQAYRAIVYDKGAYVLHMLRRLVGDDAFRRGLAGFMEAHRFGKAGSDDLRDALSKAAGGRDLSAYFEQWVFDTGLPSLRFRSVTTAVAGGHRTTLDIHSSGLPGEMPVQVLLKHDRGETRHLVVVSAPVTKVAVETKERPRRVELNADRGLLARVDEF